MKKAIVIYKSKYGTARDYARWIAEALGCECKEVKAVNPAELQRYDVVIYGGGLYAGGINGVKFIKKQAAKLKRVLVYMVGAAPAGIEGNMENYVAKNFGNPAPPNMDFYYFSGRLDYKNMSVKHKFMMKMLVKMLSKKPEAERTEMNKQIIASVEGKIDRADKSLIDPLVERAKQIY